MLKEGSSRLWYCASPVGEHTLATMVKDMFQEIEIQDKTNHSLRATGASTLFQSDVPEKIVQECTGHNSIKALRLYERTTAQQNEQVSKVLATRSTLAPLTWEKRPTPASSDPTTFQQFYPLLLCLYIFGAVQNCTINVNYAPSNINMAHSDFDAFDFPPQIEEELCSIEMWSFYFLCCVCFLSLSLAHTFEIVYTCMDYSQRIVLYSCLQLCDFCKSPQFT